MLAGSAVALGLLAVLGWASVQAQQPPAAGGAPNGAPANPALSVSVVQPQTSTLPVRLLANGSIAAWQEASIGTEANGLRLASVRVGVGDRVRRGQVLATFAAETVEAELAQTRAALAEAEALKADAAANAARARELDKTGALSAQQIAQYLTAERTAQARLEAQQALLRAQRLRVAQAAVRAPDDGIVSARSATVGAVLPAGQELFRLIRQGRLEWRAEVAATELGGIRIGMPVTVVPASGGSIAGRVRMVAPTIDPATRNGLVYVDLPAPGAAKAGMFARGEFELSRSQGLTLPQSAVLLRDGFSYVFRVEPDATVRQLKVATGRRVGDRIEIVSGLAPGARVVATGAAFLADGDAVRVVAAPAAATAAPAPAAAPASAAR